MSLRKVILVFFIFGVQSSIYCANKSTLNQLIGTWQSHGAELKSTLIFHPNLTYEYIFEIGDESEPMVVEGRYTIDDKELNFYFQDGSFETDIVVKLNKKKLILQFKETLTIFTRR
jgi:hypothetical protein